MCVGVKKLSAFECIRTINLALKKYSMSKPYTFHSATLIVRGHSYFINNLLHSPGIAFVNGTNSLGETPLFLACKLGNLEVAKAFVEWGAEPDARDKEVR